MAGGTRTWAAQAPCIDWCSCACGDSVRTLTGRNIHVDVHDAITCAGMHAKILAVLPPGSKTIFAGKELDVIQEGRKFFTVAFPGLWAGASICSVGGAKREGSTLEKTQAKRSKSPDHAMQKVIDASAEVAEAADAVQMAIQAQGEEVGALSAPSAVA